MHANRFLNGLTILAISLLALRAAPCEAQAPAPAETSAPRDVVAEAVLETRPETPAEQLRATMILIDSGAALAAKPLMTQLAEAALDDEQLAALHARFGAGVFLKLARTRELNPEAEQFSKKVSEAVDKLSRDPARIDALIAQLASETPIERSVAITKLKSGREAAVERLLLVLADANRASEHDRVRGALVAMSASSAPALAEVVHSASGDMKLQAIRAIGEIGDDRLAIHLFAPAFAESEEPAAREAATAALARLNMNYLEPMKAAARLYVRADAALNRPASYMGGSEPVGMWVWDAEARSPRFVEAPPVAFAFQEGYHFARDAHAIAPEDAAAKRLYEFALLERAGVVLSPEMEEEVKNIDVSVLEAILKREAPAGQGAGAAVAARLLGQKGMESLERDSPGASALAKAMLHPDPRVRFAAVQAVMELNPPRAYAGSSMLVKSLTHFASSHGGPLAIVGHPRAQEASRLAGILSELGYQTEIATDPISFLRLATESGACDLALVDIYFATPVSGEVLSALRRDARTAQTPIGVVLDPGQELDGDNLARKFSLTTWIMRPQETSAMDYQLKLFFNALRPNMLSVEERNAQAIAAMGWLAQLSKGAAKHHAGAPTYNLSDATEAAARALTSPELSASAAEFFAWRRSREAQRLLVDLASRNTQDMQVRRAAAAAFKNNIIEYGILLTSGEVLLQYERYNQSEKLDRETQALLGGILDAIELRAGVARSEVEEGDASPSPDAQ